MSPTEWKEAQHTLNIGSFLKERKFHCSKKLSGVLSSRLAEFGKHGASASLPNLWLLVSASQTSQLVWWISHC